MVSRLWVGTGEQLLDCLQEMVNTTATREGTIMVEQGVMCLNTDLKDIMYKK